jgi:hypothetical protein
MDGIPEHNAHVIRDSNPGPTFLIPGFGIETFLMLGLRHKTQDHYNTTTCESAGLLAILGKCIAITITILAAKVIAIAIPIQNLKSIAIAIPMVFAILALP